MDSAKKEMEQEAEVVPAIRLEDAEWKMIQQNTFTRWVNNHLQKAAERIDSLEFGFSDGLRLLALAKVLSHKDPGRHNKKVAFRSQKLENVSVALNFFQDAEGIKIINIDSSDIVDHNKKLIMGLIWTLILHYSISMGWISEKKVDGQPEETPKQKLLNWIRSKLPTGMPVTNFTSDWNDGIALGALLAPGSKLGWRDWNPDDAQKNTQKAIDTAEKLLGVAPLITAAELIHPEIDDMSAMTYLSQFPTAKLRSPSPVDNEMSPTSLAGVSHEPTTPEKVLPTGSFGNVEQFPFVHKETFFDVNIPTKGFTPSVNVRDPNGKLVIVHLKPSKNDNQWIASYTPTILGKHTISLDVVGNDDGRKAAIDSAQVVVKVIPQARVVPFDSRVQVEEPVLIEVEDAADGPVECVVVDSQGIEHPLAVIGHKDHPGRHSAEYAPKVRGLHSVNVFYKKEHVDGSPFPLKAFEPNRYLVWGRGVSEDGVRVGDLVPVNVDLVSRGGSGRGSPASLYKGNSPKENLEKAGAVPVDVKVFDEEGKPVGVTCPSNDDGRACFEYVPSARGEYEVHVTAKDNGQPIAKSPYKVNVGPVSTSRVRAYGPGLRSGMATHPSVFSVNTNGETDKLEFHIEGPSKTDIFCEDQGNGSAVVTYTPKVAGVYKVMVKAGSEHIKDSPFVVPVCENDSSFYPSAVEVHDLQSDVHKGEAVPFAIDTTAAGTFESPVVQVVDEDLVPLAASLHKNGTGHYDAAFLPQKTGRHHVDVTLKGVAVPGSPFHVDVGESSDPSKLRIFGPGVDGPVVCREPTEFTIDAVQAGPGAVEVDLRDGSERAVDLDVLDNGDGSFTVKYSAPKPGSYLLKVVFAGEEIAPIAIQVQPQFDISGVRVDGLENGTVFRGHCLKLDVDVSSLTKQLWENLPLEVKLNFAGKEYLLPIESKGDGHYTGLFVANDHGNTKVKVVLDGQVVDSCELNVVSGSDASKCKLTGENLSEGLVGEPKEIIVSAQGAGDGGLAIDITGPAECPSKVRDNGDSSCGVEFVPPAAGDYEVAIRFGDKNKEHIPGSPFKVAVDHPYKPETVVVRELHDELHKIGEPVKFIVDASQTKNAPITVSLPPALEQPRVERQGRSRIHQVEFTPHGETGDSVPIDVLYDGNPIQGSPFTVKLEPNVNPNKLRFRSATGSIDLADGENMLAENEAVFTIDASQCGDVRTVKAEVLGPDGLSRPCDFIPVDDSKTFELRFQTDVPGEYRADVFINGKPIEQVLKVHAALPPAVEEPVNVVYDKGTNATIVMSPEPSHDNEKPKIHGDGQILDMNQEAEFLIDASHIKEVKTIRAIVIGPDGKTRDSEISPTNEAGKYELRFRTDLPGEYRTDVEVNGASLDSVVKRDKTKPKKSKSSSPRGKSAAERKTTVRVADPLKRYGDGQVVLDEPMVSSFDRYGEGVSQDDRVSVIALHPDKISCNIESKRVGPDHVRDYVSVRPVRRGSNALSIVSHGDTVDSIDYQAVSLEELSPSARSEYADQKQKAAKELSNDPNPRDFYTREFGYNIDRKSINDVSRLLVEVTMPSKATDSAEIIDNHDGTVLVKYNPKQYGCHELNIFHEGKAIQGTPVKFYVDSVADGFATVYGPGLGFAVVGEPNAFTVCAKGSHAKELSVSIEGPAQSTIKIHDNKDGTCSVTWVPPVPGEYKIHCKVGNKEVQGSPFTVLCMGEGQKRSHLSVGSTCEVALNIAQKELKGISSSITSPSGIEEPCFVRLIDGGRLGVSFTPREPGEHLITVKRDGKLLPKAPFKIKVDRSQVGDASKVEITGDGKQKAVCQENNELLVDTTKAGFGGLSVSVQGPSKAELNCTEVKAGLIKVLYKPSEPGVYLVAVKFADHHVKDSPLTVVCTGKGAGRVSSELNHKIETPNLVLTGQPTTIIFKLPGLAPMDISGRVMNPKGNTEDVAMRDIGEGTYQIKFVPEMEGVHTLSILYKDQHIFGSPFPYGVGEHGDGGAHKIRATGPGIVRGETQFPQYFNLYTKEAGTGNLKVTMEGPSKPNIKFVEHYQEGSTVVEYKVATPGEYLIACKFNDEHIADSPFKVFVAPHTGEVRKLELGQFHDQGAPVSKAFTFIVLTHRARGHLEAKVMTPSNLMETIDIVPIEDGESYAMRFIPKEVGNHYVQVTLDGAPMRDSPFRLRVGGKDLSDPTAISCSGEGLAKGTSGTKQEFIIKTANAGAGVLMVQVDGPSKVTLDAYELELGYKVRFTPLAPGDYYCSVKYNGIHIPTSPFKVPVDGKVLGGNGYNESAMVTIDALAKTSKGTVATIPVYTGDASKVEAKGAGLNKFFPGRPSMFTIDTGKAGTNLLMVGVVTSKGPCEEVLVKHHGHGTYIVNYKIHDRVKGFIFIKYGEEEIPGSPFTIEP